MNSGIEFSIAARWLKHLSLLAAIILAGCASASIAPEPAMTVPAAAATHSRPEKIIVHNFAVNAAQVSEGGGPLQRGLAALSSTSAEDRQLQTGLHASQTMSDKLVKELRDLGFNSLQQPSSDAVTGDALVIDGQFLNVDEGNRLRRLVIGFGAGASKVDSQVEVYRVTNGAREKILEFKTHADSGKMPGAAVTMGAGAAAQGGATAAMMAANAGIGGVKTYTSQVDSLTGQTADQIGAYMAQYFAQQGWITPEQAKQAGTVQVAPSNRAQSLPLEPPAPEF